MPAELIPPKSGHAWSLPAGATLKVTDVDGGQTGDVFAIAADDLEDGLSNGRSFDYNNSIRLSEGAVLYSRRSRALLTIVDDEVGVHDFLYAPCSQEMYEIGYGITEPHPNCLDNLANSLSAFGVQPAAITIAFNIFMNVDITADGTLKIQPPLTSAGKSLTFRADRDVLVAVTSCPASAANAGEALPLLVEMTTA